MQKGVIHLAGRLLDGVSESFAPPPSATTREIRINGAIAVGAGFLCALLGAITLFINHANTGLKLAMAPLLTAYAFWIVGGYRLVFGKSAKADPHEVASLQRIAFGVVWIVFLFGVPILALILFGS